MHTLRRKCSDDQEEEERRKKTTNYQNALRLQSSVKAWLLMLMMKLGMKFCCWYVSLFSSLFVCFLHCRCWRPNPRWEVHYHLRGSVSPVLQRHACTRRPPAGRKSNCLKKKSLSIWGFWCPSFILPLTSLLKTFICYLLPWLFHTFSPGGVGSAVSSGSALLCLTCQLLCSLHSSGCCFTFAPGTNAGRKKTKQNK